MKPIEVRESQPILNATLYLDKVWDTIRYKIVEKDFSFITLLKENIGGELLFTGFQFEENDTFDWYCSRGRLDEIKFKEYFLLSEKLLSQFPTEVHDTNLGKTFYRSAWKIEKEPKFDWVNEFCIEGELASLLYQGGAYGSDYKGSVKEIKHLAQRFCEELFDGEYRNEYVRCYKSDQAWNSWFNDFIIDQTLLIICMKTRTIWLLAFTDSD